MKKLVLDLDETLVCSSLESQGAESVSLSADGTQFYTMLRPGAKSFIDYVMKRFEVYIWSTGMQSYVERVWTLFDVPGVVLWGRGYCKRVEGEVEGEPFEKPLRQITHDLTQIVLVDNTPSMFAKCPLNGILIRTWRGDSHDRELYHLSQYLDWLGKCDSMQRDHRAWRIETLCIRSR